MALIVSGDGVFYTLQGEGPTIGLPAVFLRLHHCNLTCVWCDAWYTWDKTKPEFTTERQTWSLKQTWDKLKAYSCTRLVITGGEPLLQQKTLSHLITGLADWTVEIETNGTLMPTFGMLQRCQFNCSPKLAHSGVDRAKRLKPLALQWLNRGKTTFKFVVTTLDDIAEIKRDFLPHVDADKIILMPEGVDAATLLERLTLFAPVAKAEGWRLLSRLQVEIWGAERGV